MTKLSGSHQSRGRWAAVVMRLLPIAAVSIGALSGFAAGAQAFVEHHDDAAVGLDGAASIAHHDEKEHVYAVHQTIEVGGHMVTHSGNAGMWDTLVNTHTGPRILSGSFQAHTLNSKKTPFFDDLTMNSFGYGGDPYASSILRMHKGRAYKLDANFRRNRQYFNYDLFGNSLIPANAVPYVPITDSPHLFNTVRKTGDVNLTVLPLSKVSFRAGYWRTTNEGPSLSSNVSKSNSNPLLNQWWRYSDDIYTGGVDWKLTRKTVLSYDQFVTSYKQDTRWDMAPSNIGFQLPNGTPVSLGLNIFSTAKNTCLVAGTANTVVPSCNGTLAYHRYAPVRTLLPTEQFRFTSASIPGVSMNGRFVYSSGSERLDHYDEYYAGWSDSSINTTGRNIIRYSGVGSKSHLGTLPRINVSADYGITAQIAPRLDISNVFDFRSFRDNDVTQPRQLTQFGTSLASTSNFFDPALCPPPYKASTCPLHTTKTAADITQTYRQSYFGQSVMSDTVVLAYAVSNSLKVSVGYRYRDRSIIKTLQNTTTSTFTPPFANRGACASVPLNSDGTCTVTPASTPAVEKNEIHENWALLGVAAQPTRDLSVKLNVEAMSADAAYTQISPRNLQHYILRTFYRPHPWMSFSGAVNILESRDNVEYVHHLAHTRDFSLGTSIQPGDKWALDLNYAYDNDYSRTDICYYSSAPLPGTGNCAISGSVANFQPFLGNGYYSSPSHFGSVSVMLAPVKKVRMNAGFQASASSGSSEVLNDRQVQGSLQSQFQIPFGDLAFTLAPGWTWKAAWNYYGYGEGSAVGPTQPRDVHGNVFTASVRHSF